MKKLRLFACIAVAVTLLCVPALAVDTSEYVLDELGLSISFPQDYVVFTRNTDENDPNFGLYNLEKESLLSTMTQGGSYLNGWDTELNQEIVISMTESPIADFNLLSDADLTTSATALGAQFTKLGGTLTDFEIYQHAQAKFLKLYFSQPDETATRYGLQYYTSYDNKVIHITMHSYVGEISATQEAMLKTIVDSAVFNTPPQTDQADLTPTAAFTYTDPNTQTSFFIPENWVEMPLELSSQPVQNTVTVTNFAPISQVGITVSYLCTDLWAAMTQDKQKGYIRSDVDNRLFSLTDIAAIMELPVDDIEEVTYGEKRYYSVAYEAGEEAYGIILPLPMEQVFFVDNGYIYFLQFSGDRSSEYYSDFKTMLLTTKTTTFDNYIAKEFNFISIFMSLIFTIAVYSLPIVIYRYGIRKAPMEKKKAKIVTIVYAIFALFVMFLILVAITGKTPSSAAIFLWSYANYRMLIDGNKFDTHETIEKDINVDSFALPTIPPSEADGQPKSE